MDRWYLLPSLAPCTSAAAGLCSPKYEARLAHFLTNIIGVPLSRCPSVLKASLSHAKVGRRATCQYLHTPDQGLQTPAATVLAVVGLWIHAGRLCLKNWCTMPGTQMRYTPFLLLRQQRHNTVTNSDHCVKLGSLVSKPLVAALLD